MQKHKFTLSPTTPCGSPATTAQLAADRTPKTRRSSAEPEPEPGPRPESEQKPQQGSGQVPWAQALPFPSAHPYQRSQWALPQASEGQAPSATTPGWAGGQGRGQARAFREWIWQGS